MLVLEHLQPQAHKIQVLVILLDQLYLGISGELVNSLLDCLELHMEREVFRRVLNHHLLLLDDLLLSVLNAIDGDDLMHHFLESSLDVVVLAQLDGS